MNEGYPARTLTLGSHPGTVPFRIAMISLPGYVAAVPPFGAPDTGGQVTYVLELSRRLSQLGHSVDIWTRRFNDQPEIEVIGERLRIIRVPCGGCDFIPAERLPNVLDDWHSNAMRTLKEKGISYDFVASHQWTSAIAGAALAKALHAPHLYTPHSLAIRKMQAAINGGEGTADEGTRQALAARLADEQNLCRKAQLVIATSQTQCDLLEREYDIPPEKLHVVPGGYNERRFFPVSLADRAALRRRFGFEGKAVLATGSPEFRKGHDLLIRAFRETLAHIPEARLYLAIDRATDAQEQKVVADCRKLAEELRISSRVIFSGAIAQEDLADVYRAVDVFALPSRHEPFGISAVEAMACGTPVVVTTRGGLWEALNDGLSGGFADPFDPAEFGRALAVPLGSYAFWERTARFGAATARNAFGPHATVRQFLWALEQCDIADRRSGSNSRAA